MSTTKKLTISVIALVVAFLAVAGTLIGVLAARNVTVTSGTVNVTYTPDQVAATVSATWKRETDASATAFVLQGSDETSKTILPTDNAGFAFAGMDSTLASNNTYIEYVFTFQNDGDNDFTATVTLPSTANNITVSESARNTTDSADATISSHSITVPANKTCTYTIRATITNLAKSATYNGTFSWALADANV